MDNYLKITIKCDNKWHDSVARSIYGTNDWMIYNPLENWWMTADNHPTLYHNIMVLKTMEPWEVEFFLIYDGRCKA